MITFIVIFATYFRWFTTSLHISNDLHFTFIEALLSQFSFPSSWGNYGAVGMGEYAVPVLWAWPVNLVTGMFAKLGLPFEFILTLFVVIPFLLAGIYGINKLLEFFDISKSGRAVGTIFYLTNTYILLLVDGGQLSIALAYSWLPIAFLSIVKAEKRSIQQKVTAGLIASVLGFFDIRFIYILALLLTTYAICDIFLNRNNKIISKFVSWSLSGFIFSIIFILINIYWILPSIFSKAPSLPELYTRVSQTDFLSFAQLKHSVSLLQPHWYENMFGKIANFRKEFLIIPVLVFLAPVLKRKKHVYFWVLVALVSVFLVKGSNPPLPNIYPWLFTNIPGFSLFRDPTKFFFLVTLSYSVLIGTTTDELHKKFKHSHLVIITILVVLVSPIWWGKLSGTFSEPIYKLEYFNLAEVLKQDNEFSRVFWVPTKSPLGFSSPIILSVEASRLAQKRPFAIGTVGKYETFNFLREANFMGELFDVTGIKYIAYPYPKNKKQKLKQDNIDYYNSFSKQIENLEWIGEKIFDFPINVYKTNISQDHLFITSNIYYVIGSDRIYNDLFRQNLKLSENALVFVEEKLGFSKTIPSHAKIILYNKEPIDFAFSRLSEIKFIFPADKLDFSPNETGWWKRESVDFAWWRDFLQQKYGIDNQEFNYNKGWAIAEGELSLQVVNEKIKKGDILFARVMESNKGGKLKFIQENLPIGELNTFSENKNIVTIKLTGNDEIPDQYFDYGDSKMHWVEVGKLKEDKLLNIETIGDINVISALIILSQNEYDLLISESEKILSQKLIEIKDLVVSNAPKPEISYEQLSSTHYKVKVNNLEKPTTIIFSETYDNLWELDGQKPHKVYSLLNGFTAEQNGIYDLYYTPQDYVNKGLAISGISLFLIISYIIKYEFRKRKKTSKN